MPRSTRACANTTVVSGGRFPAVPPASTLPAIVTIAAAASPTHHAGPFTLRRPALAKDYYDISEDSDTSDEATASVASIAKTEGGASGAVVSSSRRLRRGGPTTTPMRRKIDPLGLARLPRVLPTEQPSSSQARRHDLRGLFSRSFDADSSAMMQVFYARRCVRKYGRDRKPWSSIYMDHRTSESWECLEPDEPLSRPDYPHQGRVNRIRIKMKLSSTPKSRREEILNTFCTWKPAVWERMFTCDFCARVVSPGRGCVPCVVCNVVAHTACLRKAVLATGGGVCPLTSGVMGRGTDPRQIDFRPEFPGAAIDREDGEEWGTGGGDGGGGGGGDVFQAGRGPPRIWACGHCTQEHVLQWKEQERRIADEERNSSRFRGGHDKNEPKHNTLLDAVVLIQARWRGLLGRRQLAALNNNHLRAWSLEVLGLDLSTQSHGASVRKNKGSSAADAVRPSSPPHRYRVIVTVIEDMTPVGIKASASPIQLFRFDTPALPTSSVAPASIPAAAAAAAAATAAVNNKGGTSSSIKHGLSSPPIGGSATGGGGSVEFNSEMFVPGTKPWVTTIFSVVRQNVFSQGLKGKQPPPLPPPRERPTAARGPSVASAASPAVLVGQAFVHLKSDLMRGIGRSLSLPLSPECFRVDSLQTATPDRLPDGVTIRARFRPLSDATSKCGYINVVLWSGRAVGPTERPTRLFGVLAYGILFLYSKACSQKPPKARLPIYGASVWAKAALLQVLLRLRQPDDAGRTNVQIHATTLEEVTAWRTRLVSAATDDTPQARIPDALRRGE